MLIQMANNLGKNLIENGIIKKWAFIDVTVGILFILDEKGNLLREERPLKMVKAIPIGIYSDCFSTARVKNEEKLPFPLFDWIKVFKEETRDLYFEQLHQFDSEIDDLHIHKIVSFIENHDWTVYFSKEEKDNNKEKLKERFYVVFENEDQIIDPLDSPEVIEKINHYVWKRVNKGTTDLIDSVGTTGGRGIRKSSIVMHKRNVGVRTISLLSYLDFYYSEMPVARISTVTELYVLVAIQHLLRVATRIGNCRYILYDSCSGESIPLDFRMKEFAAFFGFNVESIQDWIVAKREIQKYLSGKKICYLEFDAINNGRLSAYQTKQYNFIETQRLINNILDYIERSTIVDESIVSYHDRVLWDICDIEGVQIKGGKESFKVQRSYSQYLQDVFRGNYTHISKRICMPSILKKLEFHDRKMTDYYIEIMSRLNARISVSAEEKKAESIEELLGRLWATAYLIEKKNCKEGQLIISNFRRFLALPKMTWKMVWPQIAKYINDNEKDMYRIIKLVKQLDESEWGYNPKDYRIVECFGLTLLGYWGVNAKRKELEHIVEYLNGAEYQLIEIPRNQKKKNETIKYKIVIQEYKEESDE